MSTKTGIIKALLEFPFLWSRFDDWGFNWSRVSVNVRTAEYEVFNHPASKETFSWIYGVKKGKPHMSLVTFKQGDSDERLGHEIVVTMQDEKWPISGLQFVLTGPLDVHQDDGRLVSVKIFRAPKQGWEEFLRGF